HLLAHFVPNCANPSEKSLNKKNNSLDKNRSKKHNTCAKRLFFAYICKNVCHATTSPCFLPVAPALRFGR
ncbi:MAG: hypothetical protein IJ990_04865, partial [Alistipes sp.]|nr:hypothetical protein [Alistipes sp.]